MLSSSSPPGLVPASPPVCAPGSVLRFSELLGQARCEGGRLDLPGLRQEDLAPAWRDFWRHTRPDPAALDARLQGLRRQIREDDVSYNVYAGDGDVQRPWAVDLFPLLIGAADWAHIRQGVLQQVRVLEHILTDVYGPQHLLREGLLPPALVQGHPDYLPCMHGVTPVGGRRLHIAAFDLARGPEGGWWIVSQRLQAPSGLGYLLENRHAVSHQFPQAFDGMHVRRLAGAYRSLMASLRQASPAGEDAHIALLTPGPYNETYFEHAYLARYLGISLVEGSDLTVRDRRLYLKTLQGLERVDVLIKRMDDQFLDPLELRPDSQLGVPGLLEALRAGHVLMANAPGAGFLESGALLGFLPALARRLIGEELALPALPTWWCGEAAAREQALGLIDGCVIKPTYPAPYPGAPARQHFDTALTRWLTPAQRAEWVNRIRAQADECTVQRYLPASGVPIWRPAAGAQTGAGELLERPAIVRVFALSNGADSWRVLPGGMARLASEGGELSSMRWGGSSADVWVLSSQQQEMQGMAPRPVVRTLAARGAPVRNVTSRAADNLFWMGRYTERIENNARLIQLILNTLTGEEQASHPLRGWLDALARAQGLVPPGTPGLVEDRQAFVHALITGMAGQDGLCSLAFNLQSLRHAASQVRDRLALEHWAEIRSLQETFALESRALAAQPVPSWADAQELLRDLMRRLSGIIGAQLDRMMRDNGWRLLSIGRFIERAGFLCEAFDLAFSTRAVEDDDGFEALLVLCDSTISFHARYQQSHDLAALLELLVHSRENPRALGWVMQSLSGRLARLQEGNPPDLEDLALHLPEPGNVDPAMLAQADAQGHRAALHALLQEVRRAMGELSQALTVRHFTHTRQVRLSLGA